MVAIRGAHLKQAEAFAFDHWIASLKINNLEFCQRLAHVWRYCKAKTFNHSEKCLLLLRGIEIVEILNIVGLDIDSLCVGLLFPLADAQIIREKELEKIFGKNIVLLVHGVRNMEAVSKLKTIRYDFIVPEQIDHIQRILLAMVQDLRCVVIKLAERIVHLREMRNASEKERLLAAKESKNIYAPLANRLGIDQLKWELEDYSFRYLHPDEYKYIAKLLHERRIDRDKYIKRFVDTLKIEMRKEGVCAEIYGRAKHIYSIWRKMQKKSLTFDELFDVRAVRIVAECLKDCYGALGTVHALYPHLPSEFDDYVTNPKPNGYQSIHTVILGPENKTLEIQLRTRKMHENAEMGFAAHWKYKENLQLSNIRNIREPEGHIAWLRKLITCQQEISTSNKISDQTDYQVLKNRIYFMMPKGNTKELATLSNIIDVTYCIDSGDIKNRGIVSKINSSIIAFSDQLKMTNYIKIISQKKIHSTYDVCNASLTYLINYKNHLKIRTWFRKQNRGKNVTLGFNIIYNQSHRENIYSREVKKLLVFFYNHYADNELLGIIYYLDLRLHRMVHCLQLQFDYSNIIKKNENEKTLRQVMQRSCFLSMLSKNNNYIIVQGSNNFLNHIAPYCQLTLNDDIAGFITRKNCISIYYINCNKLIRLIKKKS
ncbi:hypothetical protein HHS_01630 [Candidatus Pantoea carbekii]|uniref:GTP pyrophosphokinase n=1 Tax=Candidatus Pantoea carbekii TaxID=1235990 RepID=U3U8Y6_9GAMM|nr:hypothetical protein HHS_01630 [Candidatus Pantoea carbekii]